MSLRALVCPTIHVNLLKAHLQSQPWPTPCSRPLKKYSILPATSSPQSPPPEQSVITVLQMSTSFSPSHFQDSSVCFRPLIPEQSICIQMKMRSKRGWENMSVCTDLGNGSLSRDEGTKRKDDEGGAKHTDRCPSRGFDWKPLSWAPLLWGGRLLWGPHDGAAYYVQSANATQKPIRWNHSGVFPTK